MSSPSFRSRCFWKTLASTEFRAPDRSQICMFIIGSRLDDAPNGTSLPSRSGEHQRRSALASFLRDAQFDRPPKLRKQAAVVLACVKGAGVAAMRTAGAKIIIEDQKAAVSLLMNPSSAEGRTISRIAQDEKHRQSYPCGFSRPELRLSTCEKFNSKTARVSILACGAITRRPMAGSP